MRRNLAVLLLTGLVVGVRGESRADDDAAARAIVARAVHATGGEAKLAQYKARTWKEIATYHGPGAAEHYEATYTAAWPDKIKVEIGDFTLVMNGEKGWVRVNGATREMTREELDEHRQGIYCLWVMSLASLGNTEFKLSVVGDRTVARRPAAGVKVSRKGRPDVSLYFDKETGLLAMSEYRFKEARSGKEVNQGTILSGYRDVSGIRSPTKVFIDRDGKRAVEADVQLRHVEELNESVFGKP
jgi:hypothetical protein